MLEKNLKIKTLPIARRDIVIRVSLLVVAGLFFTGPSQAADFNPTTQGSAPLLLSYNREKTTYDLYCGLGLSDGVAVITKKELTYRDNQAVGLASHFLAADDQTFVINLFEIEWKPYKTKRHIVVFGMSALSQDLSGTVDSSNHSLSAYFDNQAWFAGGDQSSIFDQIEETLLMIHFTIKY